MIKPTLVISQLKNPWRSITKGLDCWFIPHVQWKVNNDECLSFWKGASNEKSPLSLYRPRLYVLSQNQIDSVKDTWNTIDLDLDLQPRRSTMRSFEVQQWNELKTYLSSPLEYQWPF